MKIIVSNNSLLKSLYANILGNKNYQVSILSELKCIDEINANNFDFALISPLIYSAISKKNDERIIKNSVLVLEDFSGEFTLNITPNKNKLSTIFFEEPNEFLIVATKLLLSVRYGIEPQLAKKSDDADIILTNNSNKNNEKIKNFIKMDLSEDWFDTFEVPLVLGFWIASKEKINTKTVEQISSFSAQNILETEQIKSDCASENDFERVGFKYWSWNDSFSKALEKTFDLLYYRNFATHIADVKFSD